MLCKTKYFICMITTYNHKIETNILCFIYLLTFQCLNIWKPNNYNISIYKINYDFYTICIVSCSPALLELYHIIHLFLTKDNFLK